MLNVIEGPDYSGKSTITNKFSYTYDYTRLIAPGHTKVGKFIRSITKSVPLDDKTNCILMAVDWLLSIEKHNAYEIACGSKIFIGDRNPLISGMVYQNLDGENTDFIIELYKKILGGFDYPVIDNLIILDVNIETLMQRKKNRASNKPDVWDDRDQEYFEKLIRRYSEIGKEINTNEFLTKLVNNIIYVDANRSAIEIYNVVEKILVKSN